MFWALVIKMCAFNSACDEMPVILSLWSTEKLCEQHFEIPVDYDGSYQYTMGCVRVTGV